MRDEPLTTRMFIAASIYQGLLFQGQDAWTGLLTAFKLTDEFLKLSKMSPEEISGVESKKNA